MSELRAPLISFGLDDRDVAQPRWLWHGILAPGKITLLTSLWKSGKTTLLAHLLARRCHGGDFLGLAVAPGTSLIVSEEPRDLWPQRFHRHRLGKEVGVVSRPFTGRPTLAQLTQLNAQMMGLKQQRGVDLVVFDTLAMFLPTADAHPTRGDRSFVELLEASIELASPFR